MVFLKNMPIINIKIPVIEAKVKLLYPSPYIVEIPSLSISIKTYNTYKASFRQNLVSPNSLKTCKPLLISLDPIYSIATPIQNSPL